MKIKELPVDFSVVERAARAKELFEAGYNCCQAVVLSFSDIIDGVTEGDLAGMTAGFGGGMGRMREVCGTVSAMAFICGILYPSGPGMKENKTKCYELVQKMAGEFRAENGSIICRELLGLDKGPDSPVPSERTGEYYKKRPCGELCAVSAGIIAKNLIELRNK